LHPAVKKRARAVNAKPAVFMLLARIVASFVVGSFGLSRRNTLTQLLASQSLSRNISHRHIRHIEAIAQNMPGRINV
jgi:hypothetical protein